MRLPDRSSDRDAAHSGRAGELPNQRLRALLDSLAAGVLRADLTGRFTYANPAALRILGVSEAELLGHTFAEAGVQRYDEMGVLLASEKPPSDSQDERSVIQCMRIAARERWIETKTSLDYGTGVELLGTLQSFVDVSDRIQLQALEHSGSTRLNSVLRSMAAGVLLVDPEGRIQFANPAAAALSGLKPEDVIGQLAADPAWQLTDEAGAVVPYEALPVPTALREQREVIGAELGVPTMSGVLRWIRVSVVPLFEAQGALSGAVVTTEDVTERHTLAEQLLQTQKIEGIGQLAGGIAHDFNNLLTIIMGNAELASAMVHSGSDLGEEITEIRDAAHRGAALTRQILTFARKQVVQAHALHLDRLIGEMEKLLQRAVGDAIQLRMSSAPDLWPVKVDPGQMQQVILNMTLNARDAMPSGGELLVDARNTTLDASHAQALGDIEPGDFVMLSIADTGSGIARELLTRIYDPFFSTKPSGLGTGLGLSICHAIIRQARGFITVESELGKGTAFRVHLPRCRGEVLDASADQVEARAHGTATILLVEDQEAVRNLVARALRGYGYGVVSAADGLQALSMHKQMTERLDLLVTDVAMPRMGGLELAKALRARIPNLPVLFMTGYFDSRNPAFEDLSAQHVLLKPFTPMQLVQRVEALLAEVGRLTHS